MEKKRILVADRDVDVGNSIREFLKDDYEVFFVDDGQKIIPYIKKYQIDLILTDIEISNIYFFNLITEIKQLYPNIPVLIMYVYCDYTQEIEETIRRVADAIFLKPFDLQELRKRIDTLLLKSMTIRSESSR